MTGRSDFCLQPAQKFHPVHARHLNVEDGEIGRIGFQPVERACAVGVGLDTVTFGFKG